MVRRKCTGRLNWKYYGLAAATLIFTSAVFADRPAPERQYTVTSANETYEFTMHPTVHSSESTTLPYGEASRANLDGEPAFEPELLWRVEGWYAFETFISDDGRGLIRLGPWANKLPHEELAIAFYRDGHEIQRYSVADLLEDNESVERSVSHYTWHTREDEFPHLSPGGQFRLLTVEDRVITFDSATGEILSDNSRLSPLSVRPQVTREQVDDQYFAENLFRENQIDIDSETINRILRDGIETVVWVSSRFEGLPVFHRDVGYSFAANRRVNRRSDTGEPEILGQPLPPSTSFPIDHRPDIDQEEAIRTWLIKSREDEFLGAEFEPHNGPELILGFHDLHFGSGRKPEYRLAWRVRPMGSRYPVAMVGAKKGDILFFDSGDRTARPSPSPAPAEPSAEPFVGEWHAGSCGERGYKRELTLYLDGRFGATDYVSPCPEGATCVWSGIIQHNGTWQVRNAWMIELTPGTSSPGRGAPLPRAMGFESQTGRLHEATPGASVLCEYQRSVDTSPPIPNTEGADETSACHKAVQGRIAWDHDGNMQWQDNNVRRLCAGAGQSTEPARCFKTAMHGSAERGDDSGWNWQQALDLCVGTSDADATIGCFESTVAQGSEWSDAIVSCRAVR